MKFAGICIGSASISIVGLENKNDAIRELFHETLSHDGNPKEALVQLLEKHEINNAYKICITGRKIKNFVNLTSITEPEAVEYALEKLVRNKEKYNAIVSAGSETIMVYELMDGKIFNVHTGNKCASGTGAFLIQQLGRMDLVVDDLKDDYDVKNIYEISGRCSVFCKSDCTHALNKGVDKSGVVAGLCNMISIKITELLSIFKKRNIIMIGGLSKVKPVVSFIRDKVDSLLIPEQNGYFEAYGSALWATENDVIKFTDVKSLFKPNKSNFDYLKPLSLAKDLVDFKTMSFEKPEDGDECILGLDIGSTTTKAVLLRTRDNAVCASVYLRTGGDPVKASRECYEAIRKQTGKTSVKITGLGTTGSGRYIAGVHAMTESIYNEIICHATASVFFDKDVDTIFEIGGQDAKYTFITQGIPSEYAMNEACSAGTGSFLEESAKESINVELSDISELALQSKRPPNFNDQCSAFISSDIKTAFQENIPKEDIIAGLVYSICLNYNNRVRGARSYGKKIFMQGGVCYNKSVPIAMASLLNTKIIVPPEPGLMGAFGCALEVKKRIDAGLLQPKHFNIDDLIAREIRYHESFICRDLSENCDRKCEINMLEVEGNKIPFGGACNKYYNMILNVKKDTANLDLVSLRERMIFSEFAAPSGKAAAAKKTIGINRSFFTNSMYPLYFNFWDQLGFKVVLSEEITKEGREKKKSSFCYPAEIAHGAFDSLLKMNPDFIFMPHVTHIPVQGSKTNNKNCVFVQGEPYYLKDSFKDRDLPEIISPIIDFQKSIKSIRKEFIRSAILAGAGSSEAGAAFDFAYAKMNEYYEKARSIGKLAIEELEKTPDEFAVVLIGRYYNALSGDANMSIPHKFASKGIKTIPFDFIPYENEELDIHMHWGIGKIILKTASFIKKHQQLFGTYVTNFSCGPDSFLVPYFRDEMGKKPSLTLELDSHTADVGLNTRIEAAIDIIRHYRQLNISENISGTSFNPAQIIYKGTKVFLKDSSNRMLGIKDPSVTFLFPKMGRFLTEGGIAALKSDGFNAKMVDQPDNDSLSLGKANSNCKECLPYIMLAGSLLDYIKKHKKPGEKIAYFIVGDPSPCRVEQYQVGFKKLIEKNHIEDVAVLTLSSSDGFAGMGLAPLMNVWRAFCIADVMEQIYSAVMTLAVDREKALEVFNAEWQKLLMNLEGKDNLSYTKRLKSFADELLKLELVGGIEEAMRVTITGEMYVRNEEFSRQKIERTLADMGFVSRITPLIEWHYYVGHILRNKLSGENVSLFKRIYFYIQSVIESSIEKKIKRIFAKTHLYEYDPIDIKAVLETSKKHVTDRLIGDVGITVGVGLRDILKDSCGIISMGPFACIQTRMAESILNNNMNVKGAMLAADDEMKNSYKDYDIPLPYLAIESDGNPFPQIIEARLEVFAMQARRIASIMREIKNAGVKKNYRYYTKKIISKYIKQKQVE